jgi:hypothetical protein
LKLLNIILNIFLLWEKIFIPTKQKYKSLKNKLTLPVEINRDMVDELVDKNKNDKDEFFRTLFI